MLLAIYAKAQTTVDLIGISPPYCGTALTQNVPAEYDGSAWGPYNSWSAFIYYGSEIGMSGNISSIQFFVDDCFSPNTYDPVTNQKIYLAHTNESVFSNTTRIDNDPQHTDLTQVFSGSISWQEGTWNTITFDTPFNYDQTKNLLVYFTNEHGSEITGGSFMSNPGFIWNNRGANRAKYRSGSGLPGNAINLQAELPIAKLTIAPTVLPARDFDVTISKTSNGNYLYWDGNEIDFDNKRIFINKFEDKLWKKIYYSDFNQQNEYFDSLDNSDISYYQFQIKNLNDDVVFEKILSIENEINSRIKFYPNPVKASESIAFNESGLNIVIFDLTGKKILETYIENNQLKLPDINSGNYLLVLKSKDKLEHLKLIIQ